MTYQIYQLFLDNYYNKQTDVTQTDVKHSDSITSSHMDSSYWESFITWM